MNGMDVMIMQNDQGAILHKVAVLDEVDYRARTQEDTVDDGRDFFCNNFFDTRLRR